MASARSPLGRNILGGNALFTIETYPGFQEVTTKLATINSYYLDMWSVHWDMRSRLRDIFVDDTKGAFFEKKNPNTDEPWELWADEYAQQEEEHGRYFDDFVSGALQRGGPDRNNYPGPLEQGAYEGWSIEATTEDLFVSWDSSSSPDYWQIHQGEGEDPVIGWLPEQGMGIPPRPYIGVSGWAEDKVVDLFDEVIGDQTGYLVDDVQQVSKWDVLYSYNLSQIINYTFMGHAVSVGRSRLTGRFVSLKGMNLHWDYE